MVARGRRFRLLVLLVALALAITGVAVALGSRGSPSPSGGQASGIRGASATTALLRGIPQQGIALGRVDAPVTLVEFADLRCPICREYTLRVLPTLIGRYVRTGRLRLELRLQTFVGEATAPGDSERAARAALAAGAQNRLWQFADLFYRNQGDETRPYVTDAFVRQLSGSVPGLDASRVLAGRSSAPLTAELQRAAHAFDAAHFTGTPSFLLGRTGGPLTPISLDPADVGGFSAAVARALGRP